MKLKIERNFNNGGFCCYFKHKGEEYFADVCHLPHMRYSELMIFKSKNKQISFEDASGLYTEQNVPVTEELLESRIKRFVKTL